MDNKHRATNFLTLVAQGDIARAFDTYVDTAMQHHNKYTQPGAQHLQRGMEENHKQFPNKKLTIKHVIGEGDFVAVHSRMELDSEKQFTVVHIMRFENHKIVELWDVAQPAS